jgi:hypothetical protein
MSRTGENLEQDNIQHHKRAEMATQNGDLHHSEKEGIGWRVRGKGKEGTKTATVSGRPAVPSDARCQPAGDKSGVPRPGVTARRNMDYKDGMSLSHGS